MDTFTLQRKRNEFGEFVIRCYRDGIRYPLGDYHTDDWEDAKCTLRILRENEFAFSPV